MIIRFMISVFKMFENYFRGYVSVTEGMFFGLTVRLIFFSLLPIHLKNQHATTR